MFSVAVPDFFSLLQHCAFFENRLICRLSSILWIMRQTANFLAAKSAKLVVSPLLVDPLMIHVKMFFYGVRQNK